MRRREEVVCSFHWACAIFPTVIFKLHGKRGVFLGQKYKFSQYELSVFFFYRVDKYDFLSQKQSEKNTIILEYANIKRKDNNLLTVSFLYDLYILLFSLYELLENNE